MKQKYIWIVCIGLAASPLRAQVRNASEAVPFLKITPDARSAGMGETGTAFADGAFSFYHNAAAGLFSEAKGELAYSYTPWMREQLSGSALHTVSGYWKISDKQGVFAGFRHFTAASTERMDEEGNAEGSFTPRDWALDFGYSRQLRKNLSLALTCRYIRSDMGTSGGAEAAGACAFDVGIYYRHGAAFLERALWAVGLQIADVGSRIKYAGTSYDLPARIKGGGALYLPFTDVHRLRCGLEAGYQFRPSGSDAFSLSAGAEYLFFRYFALRGGYCWGDKNKGIRNSATLGGGARWSRFAGDFSWSLGEKDSMTRNTYRITFAIGLEGRNRK